MTFTARIGLMCCFVTLCCASAHAQGTYTAASCNESDVNAVINGPTHNVVNGDVIRIPAGTCTWTSQLLGPSGVNFQLIGTGTPNYGSSTTGAAASCANGTTGTYIIDDYTSAFGMIEMLPSYSASYNAPASRVSCMSIDPESTSTALWDPILLIGTCTSAGCPAIRVDNITFGLNTPWSEGGNSSDAEAGILVENAFGVLDHNSIGSSGNPANNFELFNSELGVYLGVGQYGDNSWAQPDSFGGPNNLFAENNIKYDSGYLPWNDSEQDDAFTNRGGARTVLRYNVLYGQGSYGIFQDHGTDSGGRARSSREEEVYDNTLYCGASSGCPGLDGGSRGGTGLFFANQFIFTGGGAGSSWALGLPVYRNVASWGVPFAYCGGGSAYDQNDGTVYYSGTMSTSGSGVLTMTDTSQSFTNLVPTGEPYSVYDVTQGFYAEVTSNTSTTITILGPLTNTGAIPWTGFNNGDSYQVLRATICLDQPGRGQGNYISGTIASPTGWVDEVLDPIYRWGDTYSGGTPGHPNIFANDNGRLVANRDFYDQASGVQTSPTSPFNGTSGTGWGTTANRPTSCTPHVGYFETDANSGIGELYLCTATNAWTAYYQPYTYPHPLDGGTGGDPPTPPTSLTATPH